MYRYSSSEVWIYQVQVRCHPRKYMHLPHVPHYRALAEVVHDGVLFGHAPLSKHFVGGGVSTADGEHPPLVDQLHERRCRTESYGVLPIVYPTIIVTAGRVAKCFHFREQLAPKVVHHVRLHGYSHLAPNKNVQ